MADLPAPPQLPDSWSTTEARVIKHNHMWRIRGFSSVLDKFLETSLTINDDQIGGEVDEEEDDEPDPPSAGNEPAPLTFKLRVHPQGNRDSNKEYTFFQAFLLAPALALSPYKYTAKFTVYNCRNEEVHTTVYVGTQQVKVSGDLMGHFEYVRRDQLLQHILPADELRLHLSLRITTEPLTETCRAVKKEEEGQIVPNYLEISKDLESFMQTGKLTDFKIELHDGREIECHKAMLAARSPVFQAMLEPHTEESQTGKVAIGGVEYEVMREMLHFIYTGVAPNLPAHALDLLAVADRYQLQGLKEAADQHLRNSLSVETVSRTLVHADMHNATGLRKAAISFIAANMGAVIATEGWMELVKQQGAPLVNEVLGTLVGDKPNAPARDDDDADDEDDSPDSPPPSKRARRNGRF